MCTIIIVKVRRCWWFL